MRNWGIFAYQAYIGMGAGLAINLCPLLALRAVNLVCGCRMLTTTMAAPGAFFAGVSVMVICNTPLAFFEKGFVVPLMDFDWSTPHAHSRLEEI